MKRLFGTLWFFTALGCLVVRAQVYDTNNVVVNSFVGSGFYGHVDGQGELTMFDNPTSVVADSSGNLFVLDRENEVIRKVSPDGTVTTFAGGGQATLPGYGTDVFLGSMQSMIIDHADTLWIASSYGGGTAVRRMSAAGEVTTMAGSFTDTGYVNGPGTQARFNGAWGITWSGKMVFVGDSSNHRIRRILLDPLEEPVPDTFLDLAAYAGLQISGRIGRVYRVESSADMTNWVSEATLLLPADPYLWIDPTPLGDRKFYRAFLLP